MMERRPEAASRVAEPTKFYRVLEALARGDDLASLLRDLTLALEEDIPGSMASVLLLDESGKVLLDGAGPNLPQTYRNAINGLAIGPDVGCCGRAAFVGEQVIVDDIEHSPFCSDYLDLVLPLGLRACWSHPIKDSAGKVLGTFAIYFREVRYPAPGEMEQVVRAGFIAGLAIYRDRSERAIREAHVQAARAHQHLLDAVNSLNEGFWLHDREDRLILVNETVKRRFAARGQSIELGMTGREVMLSQIRAQLHAKFKAADDPGVEKLIEDMLRADGQPVDFELIGDHWIRMISHRIADGGRACLTIDITEAVRRERDLRAAKESAEAANFAKSRFLANMSHELRTPLNAILGFSEVIAKRIMGGQIDDVYAGYAQDIHFSGGHLRALIDNILDISKVEAGEDELRESEVDVAAVFSAAKLWQEEQALAAAIQIEVAVTPDNLRIWADERQIRQVAINLLSNAVKFSNRGSAVRLAAAHNGKSEIVIEVVDRGIGIAAEDIPEVMRPFGRINNPLQASQNREGIGLGLPLVKSIVEAHGGRLEIESTLGEGTTVRAILPPSRLR